MLMMMTLMMTMMMLMMMMTLMMMMMMMMNDDSDADDDDVFGVLHLSEEIKSKESQTPPQTKQPTGNRPYKCLEKTIIALSQRDDDELTLSQRQVPKRDCHTFTA